VVNFSVNGRAVSVEVSADTPLLWVLRENLQLTGTKFGCGIGQCGACTVHLDGAAQKSCQLPVSTVEGKAVVTIEGLSSDGSHAVQRAWIAEQVP
jgi:aerobic-type carbon monoxide dehydrogenase small subunit (CoxS/CutS family)